MTGQWLSMSLADSWRVSAQMNSGRCSHSPMKTSAVNSFGTRRTMIPSSYCGTRNSSTALTNGPRVGDTVKKLQVPIATRTRPPTLRDSERSSAAHDGVHFLGGHALQRRHDVRVGVERQTDLRVPEGLHNRPRVDALREQQRRGRVAWVMKPDVREPGGPENRLELSMHVSRFHRDPYGRGKDHPRVGPSPPGGEAVFKLAGSMRSKGVAHDGRKHDRSATAGGLRFGDVQYGLHCLQLLPRLVQGRGQPAPAARSVVARTLTSSWRRFVFNRFRSAASPPERSSVCRTDSTPESRSTDSHRNPSASPRRNPSPRPTQMSA